MNFIRTPRYLQSLNGSLLKNVELTDDEKHDVDLAVQYFSKRLATGSATSPMNHEEQNTPLTICGVYDLTPIENYAFRMAPKPMIAHDLIHARVSYTRNEGKSSLPSYTRVNSKDEQQTTRESVEEELIVTLWDSGQGDNFIEELFSNNPQSAVDSFLFESNPIEFYLQAFAAFAMSEQLLNSSKASEERVRNLYKEIQENRSPEYMRIFTDLYTNFTSETRGPKIFLHEFLLLLEPLLKRLR